MLPVSDVPSMDIVSVFRWGIVDGQVPVPIRGRWAGLGRQIEPGVSRSWSSHAEAAEVLGYGMVDRQMVLVVSLIEYR